MNRAHERLRRDRPLVIGHRGARVGVVENTLRAFALAADVGADGIELDVRLSRTGDVVVLHDEDLARVTNGADVRRAEELSTSELGAVDLGGEGVPTLGDVLELAERRGLIVNVEMKRDVPDKKALVVEVARLLGSFGDRVQLLVSSFDPPMLAFFGAKLRRVPRALLVHASSYHDAMMWAPPLVGAAFVNAENVLIDPRRASVWRRLALEVWAWTVNSANEARALEALGVRGIITDDPAYVLSALTPSAMGR